jgi:transcription initiation factor TFIIB
LKQDPVAAGDLLPVDGAHPRHLPEGSRRLGHPARGVEGRGEPALYTGPEWGAFTHIEEESRSRVGLPLSLSIHDKGLTTVIARIGKDAYGRNIPLDTKLQMLRLRRWQIRSSCQSSVNRNLSQAMTELSRLSDRLHTPAPVKEKAAVIYRKTLYQGLIEGRSISAIA